MLLCLLCLKSLFLLVEPYHNTDFDITGFKELRKKLERKSSMTENLHRHNWIATFDLQTLELVSIGGKSKT